MKERPILFSGPMVRAILEGRKTQTRRVVKPPLSPDHLGQWEPTTIGGTGITDSRGNVVPEMGVIWHTRTGQVIGCPYGQTGDNLWVRETWADLRPYNGIAYRADVSKTGIITKWKPSIFMPRWASRITLEITGVRVERVQEITAMDCISEGIKRSQAWDVHDRATEEICSFLSLWDSINGKKHPWVSNPWVWVISFKRIEN